MYAHFGLLIVHLALWFLALFGYFEDAARWSNSEGERAMFTVLWADVAIACVFVSAATQSPRENSADQVRRDTLRRFIDLQKSLRPGRHDLIIAAWAATLVWVIFAVGPGVVLKDDLPANTLVTVEQTLQKRQWGPERYGW